MLCYIHVYTGTRMRTLPYIPYHGMLVLLVIPMSDAWSTIVSELRLILLQAGDNA